MKVRLWVSLLAIFVVAAVALTVVLPRWNDGATRAAGLQTFIDTNTDDGICDLPPDSSRTVAHPTGFDVAVCVEDPTAAVAVFSFNLLYNKTILVAPEVANSGAALDDNPNANQAALGGGWDCSSFGQAFPMGDKDEAGDPPTLGRAFLGCLSLNGPWTFTSTNYLALVHFTTQGITDTTSLTLASVTMSDPDANEIGSCNPDVIVPMPCVDGSVTVTGGAPPPTATNTPTPTRTPTITPTPTVTPTPPPFDCVFEDDYGWGTSLGIKARNWTFMGPGAFKVSGTGVMHIRDRVIVSGKSGSVRVFGVGMCPSGPARATAVNMSIQRFGVLRLSDISP
jgi:hypothetical protein